jgi:hypothetical protein
MWEIESMEGAHVSGVILVMLSVRGGGVRGVTIRLPRRYSTRGVAVREQEMGCTFTVYNPGAAAFDAHATTPQRLTHLRRRAGLIF